MEVDGGVHETKEQVAHDLNRDAYLRSLDYEILRFSNEQILRNIEAVLTEIAQTLLRLRPSLLHTPESRDR